MNEDSIQMRCEDALPLVPTYLDGEVSEAQAAPLRQHLLACAACRGSAQEQKTLHRWFEPCAAAAVSVPAGFSARVARRAFAGDTGERPAVATAADEERGRLLRFVLQATAVAAALMLALAIALRSEELPPGDDLRAEDRVAPKVEDVIEKLERLNADDARARLEETPAGTDAGSGE
jgi:hypothetical protein